ncbi:phosphate acyltransferase [Kordiimonas sediminis]|uniref:Phosphate acyltransferase n=1 Tax=Kordiimonas sediminis TaxID=1735581 RepID=A0A919EA23_9PROT|nr:phosphate acyltransferase PlsX [Kordiimonas sediminis]GHF29044.1 phosphate acyltransferase [Kordiimonas sediminis]
MSKNIIIAIDAMGGDNAPKVVIEGMSQARTLYPDTRFLAFGDEAIIGPLVAQHSNLENSVEIIHTSEIVSADDKPSQALRRGRQSSMGLAIQAVKDKKAHVAISAGNTGAQMALAKFILRTMPGIERPALISPMPTLRGESVMLDLGANIECDAHNLVQFAIMGAAYVRTVLGLSRPTVGLLNVGVEDLKGKENIRQAAEILKAEEHLHLEFSGFVEGNAIGAGDVDVVVTDGFTGNIALKTAEGTARLVSELLTRAFTSSTSTKIGYLFAKRGLQSLRSHMDPNNHNGGVFLGLNGLVVKSHGGANANGFATAISTAIDMAKNDLIRLISEELAQTTEVGQECGDDS